MTDAGLPAPDGVAEPPGTAAHRFNLDETDWERDPRNAQWLRDWWWTGTRTQRWTAAIGAPLALLLLMGTVIALTDDDSGQQAQTTLSTGGHQTTSAGSKPTPTRSETAIVTTILTGDTVVVLRDSDSETVRLIGIDAPEVAGSPAGLQCWAVEALAFASATLLQQEVRLIPDPTQDEVDASGMTLAYLLLPDGRDFSVLSASAGQARSYPGVTQPTKIAEIAAAEQAARTSALGLWGPPCNGGLALPAPADEPAPTTGEPAPGPPPVDPPGPGTDPRFRTCGQARAAGYGPYRFGTDPEYFWYPDKNHDGVVCDK